MAAIYTLQRIISHPTIATLGFLHDEDNQWVCHIMEDEAMQGKKIPGESRIPAGEYPIIQRRHGGYLHRMQNNPKIPRSWLEWMPEITNVPGFTDVLCHNGVRPRHSRGCLITGLVAYPQRVFSLKEGTGNEILLGQSNAAFRKLYDSLKANFDGGRECRIKIVNPL